MDWQTLFSATVLAAAVSASVSATTSLITFRYQRRKDRYVLLFPELRSLRKELYNIPLPDLPYAEFQRNMGQIDEERHANILFEFIDQFKAIQELYRRDGILLLAGFRIDLDKYDSDYDSNVQELRRLLVNRHTKGRTVEQDSELWKIAVKQCETADLFIRKFKLAIDERIDKLSID